jgi:two-component sensor histidine kinase
LTKLIGDATILAGGSQTSAGPDLETLLTESNHRIANNLALIAAVARSTAFALAAPNRIPTVADPRQILAELASRIEAVAALHRLLSCAPRFGAVSLGIYLREVCAGIARSFASENRFDTEEADESCILPADQGPPLALIVHELVTNAIKYAHPAGAPGVITVSCARGRDGAIELVVADDGVGLPEGMDPEDDSHSGFAMVRMLANQIGAKVSCESTPLGLSWLVRVGAP